ncbi:MAG: hypothetical protein NTV10_07995 [Methanoregula sp.]|nr:hypothetical protein [Methanoregula sp.]
MGISVRELHFFHVLLIAMIVLCVPISVVSAAIPDQPVSPDVLPELGTGLENASFPGYLGAQPYHEPDPVVTLINLEMNQTTFPGPRSMGFGPRYIRIATTPATLVILIAGACGLLTAVIWYKKRRLDSENTEEDKIL